MKVTRTFDFLDLYRENWPDKPDVFGAIENKKWVTYSTQDYINYSNWVSYGLLALGIQKGDIVATITNNRPEWNFVDIGLAQIGAIHLPVFTTLGTDGYEIILGHSNPKMIFTSNASLAKKIESIKSSSISPRIFTFDVEDEFEHWKTIIEIGKKEESNYKEEVELIKESIKPNDWVTLLYTSGTTGNSKGVMLSHENLLSNAYAASQVFNLKPEHKYLSILPVCHVGERMANYQTQLSGCSLYYAENIGAIARDLQNLKPDGFGAVPRILEKVYDRIMATGATLKGPKKALFDWAMDLGHRYDPMKSQGLWYTIQLKLANILIFSKWRQALGGNVKFIGIGGAMLQEKIERVFWAAGIRLLNMYGLTETSPIITINRATGPKLRVGSVGATIENVELKIAEDGEIVCKGPNVMLGYYKNDEGSRQAIDGDGWFHTGDIGRIEDEQFLYITDRKKEIFKLSNGKYVRPQIVENKLKESNLVDQCMVIGEGEKFASALISPNKEALLSWTGLSNPAENDIGELITKDEIINLYKSIVDNANKVLDKDCQLKRVRLVKEEWTSDTGELSPTLKLKRRIIAEKYSDIINEIFRKD